MTDLQAAELIAILREMKEHIAVVRDVTELKANLTDAEKRQLESKSRARRGLDSN